MKPSKPLLVGLTGGIACGKSNLSEALRAHGVTVIDADAISRSLTAPGGKALTPIRERFGDSVFDGDELNRGRLAGAVFGQKEQLEALNAIIHPLVFEEISRQIEAYAGLTALVIDVPLLYETGFDRECDEVWCVWAPRRMQLERLRKRGLSLREAEERIGSQMPPLEKARRADRLIITAGAKQDSALMVQKLWDDYLRRKKRV